MPIQDSRLSNDEGAAYCVYRVSRWFAVVCGAVNGLTRALESDKPVPTLSVPGVVLHGVLAILLAPAVTYQGACLVANGKNSKSWSESFGKFMIYVGAGTGLAATYYLASRSGRYVGNAIAPRL